MSKKKTILIVDDHPFFREGLRAILARNSGFEVVGEAGDGQQALRMTKELKPDLVLMDISLPDKSGIQLTGDLRHLLPDVNILIISMHAKADYITKAFQAGAKGYLFKESAAEALVQGLEAVSKGEFFLDASLSHQVVKKLMESPEKKTKVSDTAYGTLTSREQEVMRLLAEGISTKDIAQNLCISPKTVDNHRANIMSKLNLHSAIELVRYSARLGLIDVDLWKD
ncbi:MAG: response regulator transcription factor [Deltaproteobacteria bacterium]|nr:response regulator transcription factor [Deltaproteobacteria bacterium]